MQSSPVDMAKEEMIYDKYPNWVNLSLGEEIKVPEYDFEKLIQAALLKGEDNA